MAAGRVVTIAGPQRSIMAGLNCGTPSVVAWPRVVRAFDLIVAIDDDRARAAMRTLADAGIVAGETGAAGLGGLTALLESETLRDSLGVTPSTTALLLSTEGATDPAAYERIVGQPPSDP
jgi:diaminopropionate ammonia-lyase